MKEFFLTSFLALLSLFANAYDFKAGGIYYNITGSNTVEVINNANGKYAGNIVIPNKVIDDSKAYSVTSIGNDAFEYCYGLTSISIPEGVTSIGNDAFYGCSGLTSISIPEGVTSIGIHAFSRCSGLTSINIPEGVTNIENSTFYGCSSLTSINIPEGVTSIEKDAFGYCI